MNNNLHRELYQRLSHSDEFAKSADLNSNYRRPIFDQLATKIDLFLGSKQNSWVVMPGLRGVGKTTLLLQLYRQSSLRSSKLLKFYLSLDEMKLIGASINDLVQIIRYHWQLRSSTNQPILVFLDEVHFVKDWSIGCKVLFDQISPLFIICTGSSAISLNLSADSIRRLDVVAVDPLNFTEAVNLDQAHFNGQIQFRQKPDLSRRLLDAIFFARDARDAHQQLISCQTDINHYYKKLLNFYRMVESRTTALELKDILGNFINGYKTLPYQAPATIRPNHQLKLTNPEVNFSQPLPLKKLQIRRAINKTLLDDTIALIDQRPDQHQLSPKTINLLPVAIVSIANKDITSHNKLARSLGVNIKTLNSIFSVLIDSGLIIKVGSLKSVLAKTTKTAKYLFASPALRQSLLENDPAMSGDQDQKIKGRLLEDLVAMYLKRINHQDINSWILERDIKTGGADFVFYRQGNLKQAIVVEVGYNKTSAKQAHQTLKSYGLYGLVITTNSNLRLDEHHQVVYLPLEYFLLV